MEHISWDHIAHAHAKINLHMEITGKRADGYHEIVTLFCKIDLADTLSFDFKTGGVNVLCDHPDVPDGPENLAYQAAMLFFSETGIHPGLTIKIEKNIPAGAGLGGGSSDAAAVLSVLNRKFNEPLSPHRLHCLALKIGADVPYFLHRGPALATGIGEKLAAFSGIHPYPVIIIDPCKPLSTAEVYNNLNFDLTKTPKKLNKRFFKLKWDQGLLKYLKNDLEPVASSMCPDISTAKSELKKAGSLFSMMSGSGSCVFGFFNNTNQARKAARTISGRHENWRLFVSILRTDL